jgi:hypothetical protein
MKEEFRARMKQLQENGDGRVDPKGVAVFAQVCFVFRFVNIFTQTILGVL